MMRTTALTRLVLAALLCGGLWFYGCGSNASSAPPADDTGGDDTGGDDTGGDDTGGTTPAPADTFPTSLHATGRGKVIWYDAANGGFEQETGIPYNDLSCQSCHQPRCENCHDAATRQVTEQKCLSCHGRQAAEASHYSDVHRDAGMTCLDCHSLREMHGDGTEYDSLLDHGAMDTTCQKAGCHEAIDDHLYHRQHAAEIDCSACHMQSVVTCYNCHFETEVEQHQKRPYGQFKDWLFLLNRDGKVYPGNFQSVTYQGHSFVAMAPYYAHTIARRARTCNGCHDTEAGRQYGDTGAIQAVTWHDDTQSLSHLTGVIPVPPDFETSLRMDFVDLVDGRWQFLEPGPDRYQLRWGTPLTAEQMANLTP